MLSLLLLVTALAAPATAAGYLPPGAPETGGVRHLCLIHHGQARRPEWTRWQGDAFTPRAARFLRLAGLTNSTGQALMQVVEFEVYGPEDAD